MNPHVLARMAQDTMNEKIAGAESGRRAGQARARGAVAPEWPDDHRPQAVLAATAAAVVIMVVGVLGLVAVVASLLA